MRPRSVLLLIAMVAESYCKMQADLPDQKVTDDLRLNLAMSKESALKAGVDPKKLRVNDPKTVLDKEREVKLKSGHQAAKCQIDRFLSPKSQLPHGSRGFMPMCAYTLPSGSIHVKVYVLAQQKSTPVSVVFEPESDFSQIREILQKRLRLDLAMAEYGHPELKQPWQMFTTSGVPINSKVNLLEVTEAFIFSGGNFYWPGVQIGHIHNATFDNGVPYQLETVSMRPLVFVTSRVFNEKQTDWMKQVLQSTRDRMCL